MVKHVILWQLKDELSDAEKAAAGRVGEDARLLIARLVCKFPHVPPRGKPLRHIWPEPQN